MGFLADLGKTIVQTSILTLTGEFVRRQLNELIKRQITVNVIKLCLFLLAMFISYVSIFGKTASLYISSFILTGLLLHAVIKAFLNAIAWAPILWDHRQFISMGIKGSRPTEILASYIILRYPWAFKMKAALDAKLKGWVPSANDLVDYVWAYIEKRFLVFGVSLAVFLVSFNLIIRPMLQLSILGIGRLKIYLAPFAMAIDFIFKTELTRFILGTP